MTIDEQLRLPCGVCGKKRDEHVGKVFGCPRGYGTSWNPEGKRDERVWPSGGIESFSEGDEPPMMIGTEALGNGNDHFGVHEQNEFCKQRGCIRRTETPGEA